MFQTHNLFVSAWEDQIISFCKEKIAIKEVIWNDVIFMGGRNDEMMCFLLYGSLFLK